LFITFEGGEGCGKSFQSRVLYRKLLGLNIPVELTYEPGGTILGNEVRRLLKRKDQAAIFPETELFLFAACRIQLVNEVICPNLEEGKVVICDRFADSTIAYQGYGRGIDLEIIKTINHIATKGIEPDLTILLDMPPEKGLSRKRTKNKDRFEQTEMSFHKRVRDGYLKLAAEEMERWMTIDATLSKIKISDIIWHRVSQLLATMQATSKNG
jgi:dTMP kinase